MKTKFQIPNSRFQMAKSKGVTLVELLLYMGILSMFLIVLTDLFVSIMSVRTESEAISAVEQDSRYLLARLQYDIRRASAITVPANPGNTANSLSLTIGGVTYTYSVAGGALQLADNLGTTNITSSETTIPALTFQKIGNGQVDDTVVVNVTINSVAIQNKGVETKTFQTTIGRRQ